MHLNELSSAGLQDFIIMLQEVNSLLIQYNLVMQSYGDAQFFVVLVLSKETKEKSIFSTCTVIEKNDVNSMHCLKNKVQTRQ